MTEIIATAGHVLGHVSFFNHTHGEELPLLIAAALAVAIVIIARKLRA
jgi:predicted N-acetyltransferase YhbS